MLSKDQIEIVKKQIVEHIANTFPDDKKNQAIESINSMNESQLEEFLIQNNLISNGEEEETNQKCIFCSISKGEIPSVKIAENKNAIAVMEINPVSRGHIIVIPKEHISSKEKFPKEIFELTNELTEKILINLKPKKVLQEPSNTFGHEIMNLIPVYTEENLSSKRNPTKKDELEQIRSEIEKPISKEEKISEKPKQEINHKNYWLPKRIP
jgi:diadenosine tetraphosphate (Ap4A) HIT family hydrolase